MFHIFDNRPGCNQHVFTDQDPRDDGYLGEVDENCKIETPENLFAHPYGAKRPNPTILAVSQNNSKCFREFASAEEAQRAGFEVLSGYPGIFPRWSDYLAEICV